MARLVTINLGYRCNSHCIMCVLPGFGAPFFSTDEVKEFIMETHLKSGDSIELSGGEPTLHRDFLDLCRFAVQNSEAEVWVLSNGRLFQDRQFAKDFARTGCKGVLIPLHSHNPLIHDEITKVKGSFYETLAGLENLQEFGVTLILRFIAMRDNYKDARNFIKLVIHRFPEQRVFISGVCYLGLAGERVEMIGVRSSDVKEYVQQALRLALKKKILAGLYLMPVCVFDQPYWKYFDLKIFNGDIAGNYWAALKIAKEDNEFNYPRACEMCELKTLCKWEWEVYEKYYGLAELHPKPKLKS